MYMQDEDDDFAIGEDISAKASAAAVSNPGNGRHPNDPSNRDREHQTSSFVFSQPTSFPNR
jgi:hypothetical protein